MLCPSCQTSNPDSAEACVECGENLRLATPGAVLAGRYEILGRLGKGGMGVVYKARDRLLSEIVAIKVLRPGGGATSEMAQRFLQEIRLARAVSHKNVCRIHEYGEDQGLKYISMAYVDGVDLKNVLWRNGPLPAAEAYDVSLQVADGLAAIHAEGIIHRDLKTANIMMDTARRQVRLMDFGIAKQWSDESGVGMTGTGQIVGSPDYMSPEQIQARKLDYRSDIYSLGIVIYEIFTARVPFHADTPVATLMKHLQEPPLLDGPGAPPLPAALVPVLRKALAKSPDQRYGDVEEMRKGLVAARDARDPGTATTHVPNLKATLRVAGGVQRDDALPVVESTGAAGAGTPTEAVTFPPTLPRKTAPQRHSGVMPAPAQPVRPTSGLTSSQARVAAGLALIGITVLVALLVTQARQANPPAETAVAVTTPATVPPTLPAATLAPVTEPPVSAAAAPPAPPFSVAKPPATTIPAAKPTPRPATPPPTAAAGPATDARPQQAAQLKALLDSAEKSLVADDYDAAIRTYDDVLRLDPENARALMGRSTAINARVTARATGGSSRAPSGRKLVAGATISQSPEKKAEQAALPPGFKATPGVEVTRDTQAADLPGQIKFETEPDVIDASTRYTLKVLFTNSGAAPIEIESMNVTTTTNGRRSGSGVPPQTRSVGPKQQGLLLSVSDMWPGNVETWSMEVSVRTSRGETYRNTLIWK